MVTWPSVHMLIDFYNFYFWHRTLAIFTTKYWANRKRFRYKHYVGEINNKWRKKSFATLISRFFTRKLTIYELDVSSSFYSVLKNWHHHRVSVSSFLCDFSRSNFFNQVILGRSFSVALVAKCFSQFHNFHLICAPEWISTNIAGSWNPCSIQVFCWGSYYTKLEWIGRCRRRFSILF